MGDTHVFLIRICGVVCLSSGLNIYLNYSSSDSYVRVALIFCVFLVSDMLVLLCYHHGYVQERGRGSRGAIHFPPPSALSWWITSDIQIFLHVKEDRDDSRYTSYNNYHLCHQIHDAAFGNQLCLRKNFTSQRGKLLKTYCKRSPYIASILQNRLRIQTSRHFGW